MLPNELYTATLLSRFRPTWSDDRSWLNNPEDRRITVMNCGLWIANRIADDVVGRRWAY